jgi:hypothetical protein
MVTTCLAFIFGESIAKNAVVRCCGDDLLIGLKSYPDVPGAEYRTYGQQICSCMYFLFGVTMKFNTDMEQPSVNNLDVTKSLPFLAHHMTGSLMQRREQEVIDSIYMSNRRRLSPSDRMTVAIAFIYDVPDSIECWWHSRWVVYSGHLCGMWTAPMDTALDPAAWPPLAREFVSKHYERAWDMNYNEFSMIEDEYVVPENLRIYALRWRPIRSKVMKQPKLYTDPRSMWIGDVVSTYPASSHKWCTIDDAVQLWERLKREVRQMIKLEGRLVSVLHDLTAEEYPELALNNFAKRRIRFADFFSPRLFM